MHRTPYCWLLPAALGMVALAAQAQDLASAPRPSTAPDPLDARAAVPPTVYRSALASFQRLSDAPPVPWREANDSVGRIGGWRAYAREASQPSAPEATATPTPTPTLMPMPMPMPMAPGRHPAH